MGQGVKGLGHSIGQTITVSYGVRAWSCWHLANRNKTSQAIHASLFKNFMSRGSQGFVGQSNVALRVEQPSVLNKFFQNYNILPRSGVRAESLRMGSENTPNFVTFWPTL